MLSSILTYWAQWLVIIMLALRAGRVIHADISDARTRKVYGIHGILASEAAFNGLFLAFLWAGGFFAGRT